MDEGIPITAPEHLTKERLKHELTVHKVPFSPNDSKDVLVKLYRNEVMARDKEPGCDLSSDEELARPLSSKKHSRTTKLANAEAYVAQVEALTDEELLEELRKHGVLAGPILDTTRAVYRKKLAQAMAEQAKASSKSRSQALPPSKELKGELSSQDDEEVEEEEEEEGEEEGEEDGTRVVATRQFTATTSTLTPKVQQTGNISKVRQRHFEIERVISPANPAVTKPKKKPAACDWSFWITFILLVVTFVVAFFGWNYYSTGDTSYVTQACTYLKSRFEW